MTWQFRKHAIFFASLLLISGCSSGSSSDDQNTEEPAPSDTSASTAASSKPTTKATKPTVRVTDVSDGDTITISGGRKVRLIGIDAPESDQCGASAATKAMLKLVLNKRVVLVKGAATDKDRHGRLLRYVDVKGKDAGLTLLKRGLAVPRYDSNDGYGEHPREDRYYRLAESPVTCKPKARARVQSADEPWNRPGPPDLDCSDIGHRVEIDGPDYHRLDADGDGIGCDAS